MAQWKEKASQGPREIVIARVQWLWSIDDPPVDLDAGPSMQWYPERWMSDSHVQLMRWEVKAMHHWLIQIAWKDSRPPGSIDSMEDLQLHCGDPDPEKWGSIWRILSRAWVESGGRVWQPGTCRAYLGQMAGRLRRTRAAAVKHKNTAMETKCRILEGALQGGNRALQAAGLALLPLPSPSPSLSPSPVPTEPEDHTERRSAPAAGAAEDPALASESNGSKPGEVEPEKPADSQVISDLLGELVELGVAGAPDLWKERLRCTVSSKRPNRPRQIVQLKKLTKGLRNGKTTAQATELIERATSGGWSGIEWRYLDKQAKSWGGKRQGIGVPPADAATQELRNRRARGLE